MMKPQYTLCKWRNVPWARMQRITEQKQEQEHGWRCWHRQQEHREPPPQAIHDGPRRPSGWRLRHYKAATFEAPYCERNA